MSGKQWLHGLGAAFIGGGAAAVSASISASLIAPGKFNLHGGIWDLVELIFVTFGLNGLLTTMAYLKQSPLPDERNPHSKPGPHVVERRKAA